MSHWHFFLICSYLLAQVLAATLRTKRELKDHVHDFRYTNPNVEWPTKFPVCAGFRQSPVNIELQEVKILDADRPPLGRSGYDSRPKKMKIFNNGHSIQITGEWSLKDTPTVFGGPLTGVYQLAQIHFHWGDKNDVGSEHVVANQSFPLEMHMVHWKTSYGDNITEAEKHDDGLVVLAFLMSIDKNVNMGIEKIKKSFIQVVEPGQETEIDPFPLSMFDLDMLKEGYVTYLGSLTTPPCSESVTWLISVRVKDVTLEEMQSFRKIHLNHHDGHNYRPPQLLHERSIYYIYENPR